MPSAVNNLYEFGEFRLDPLKRVLLRGEVPVSLTPKAFDTLLVLVQNAGRPVSKDELMRSVWRGSFVEESNLSQTIFMLRKALRVSPDDQRYIVTLPGRGYLFSVEVKCLAEDAVASPALPVSHPDEVRPVHTSDHLFAGPIFLVISAVAVLALASYSLWLRPHARSRSTTGRLMLAVLPFENLTGDSSQDYFSEDRVFGSAGPFR